MNAIVLILSSLWVCPQLSEPDFADEVAVGCDANCDGSLSLDETAIAFGYDCGRWFERNTRAGEIVFDEVSVGSSLQRTRIFVGDELDESWNLVKIVRRGVWLSQDEVSYLLHSHFGTLFIIR